MVNDRKHGEIVDASRIPPTHLKTAITRSLLCLATFCWLLAAHCWLLGCSGSLLVATCCENGGLVGKSTQWVQKVHQMAPKWGQNDTRMEALRLSWMPFGHVVVTWDACGRPQGPFHFGWYLKRPVGFRKCVNAIVKTLCFEGWAPWVEPDTGSVSKSGVRKCQFRHQDDQKAVTFDRWVWSCYQSYEDHAKITQTRRSKSIYGTRHMIRSSIYIYCMYYK